MSLTAQIRLDAPVIGAFQRELEMVESRVITRMLPEYKAAAGKLFQIETLNNPEIETTTFQLVDGVGGEMELRSNRSTNLPEVELVGEEFTQRAYDYDNGYRISEREIAATLKRNIPIEERKIALVQQSYLETLNKKLLFGDRRTGVPGFVNHPAWLRSIAPYKLDSTVIDSNQTLATLNAGADAMFDGTEGILEPDTLLLPSRRYRYLTSQARLSDLQPLTTLNFFLNNNPSIKNIDHLKELEGAGPLGEDVAIFYKRDPNCFKARVLDAFRPRPLFQINPFEAYRAYSFKYNGLIVYVKKCVHVMIGV